MLLLNNTFKLVDKLGGTILAPAVTFVTGASVPVYAVVSVIAIICSFLNWSTYVLLAIIGFLLFSIHIMYKIDFKAKEEPASSQTVKVCSANILSTNSEAEAFALEVRKEKPDIILFQEFDSKVRSAILEVLAEDYPYMVEGLITDSSDVAIFSKYELRNVEQFGDVIIKADILVDYEPVTVICVHLTSPTSSNRFKGWIDSYLLLNQAVKLNHSQTFIIGGDFNSTSGHKIFRDFISDNALLDATYGIPTWTPKKGTVPSFMSLDHLLISKNLSKVSSYASDGIGSDHNPVYATVSFN